MLCGNSSGGELGGSGGLVEEADDVGAILSIPSLEMEGGLKYSRRVAEDTEGGTDGPLGLEERVLLFLPIYRCLKSL